ncbi:MAG: type III-B CRISPR module RAMP protein Cmr1 [Herpetosiphonaceae bacterium]|nr:type III-B CRISPR module RAMP protein Cmr1 [Herpetosiphonaceae bacterium]
MRPTDKFPPVPAVNLSAASTIVQERQYELITPLCGGGVDPFEPDPQTLIRGTSIRGHLRFWWRACRGGQFGPHLADMKRYEDVLWGAASTSAQPRPSQVQIVVSSIKPGEDSYPFVIQPNQQGRRVVRANNNVAPAYAAFPLQPTQEEVQADVETKRVKAGVEFTLRILFPENIKLENTKWDIQPEIAAALWCWETFGGLGARTRRGFGALRLLAVQQGPDKKPVPLDMPPADQQQAHAWIRQHLQAHQQSSFTQEQTWPNAVPHLDPLLDTDTLRVTAVSNQTNQKPSRLAFERWNDLIEGLKAFRQQRREIPGGPGIPRQIGRNHWPEPDSIRMWTRQHLHPRHAQPVSLDPNFPVGTFPRAVFGLPIETQFKDRNRHNLNAPHADPRKTVLQLKQRERLASPLILRPLTCAGGKAVGLALLLKGCTVQDAVQAGDTLQLKTRDGARAEWTVTSDLTPAASLAISTKDGHTSLLGGETNILKAFLDTLA